MFGGLDPNKGTGLDVAAISDKVSHLTAAAATMTHLQQLYATSGCQSAYWCYCKCQHYPVQPVLKDIVVCKAC
jgi:hypothetical protein